MSCYHMNSTSHAYKSNYFITHICSIRYTSFENKLMCISNNAMNDSLYLIHHISFIMPRLSFHRKERDAGEQQNIVILLKGLHCLISMWHLIVLLQAQVAGVHWPPLALSYWIASLVVDVQLTMYLSLIKLATSTHVDLDISLVVMYHNTNQHIILYQTASFHCHISSRRLWDEHVCHK